MEQAFHALEQATRAGGHSIHIIPFMYPFHASPDDYTTQPERFFTCCRHKRSSWALERV